MGYWEICLADNFLSKIGVSILMIIKVNIEWSYFGINSNRITDNKPAKIPRIILDFLFEGDVIGSINMKNAKKKFIVKM